MGQCLASVEQWTKGRGYDYRFIGDEIFKLVPSWYRDKVGKKKPVATDYARLLLLQQALESGYEQAIWLDADLLVFEQDLVFDFNGSCAFGLEVWVQEHEGRMSARRNVHNAVCVFRKGCVVLPFLIYTVASIIRRVHPDHIAPQMVGPKLLTALHSICGFPLLPQVGALSPDVVGDICKGRGPALDLLRRKSEIKPKALNLCASLIDAESAQCVITTLLDTGGRGSTRQDSNRM
jgi:hypothetical protein